MGRGIVAEVSVSIMQSEVTMEQQQQANLGAQGARRNEDIAVDLLRVIAANTQTGRPSSTGTGFGASHPPRTEDQVEAMLDLYRRCLAAIEGK